MTVSSSPRGEHHGRPGTTWETELRQLEVVVPDRDDSPTVTPRLNRATRRRLAREARRSQPR